MSNTNMDFDEFLEKWEKEHPVQESSENINKKDCNVSIESDKAKRPSSGRHLAQVKKQSNKNKNTITVALAVVALAVLSVVIIFVCKSCFGNSSDEKELEGIWYYNEYTEYEFDGNGSGKMYYDKGKWFDFTYDAKGGTVSLDFELDYVTDCEYKYLVEGDNLLLIGGEGTAQPGTEYELTKKDAV